MDSGSTPLHSGLVPGSISGSFSGTLRAPGMHETQGNHMFLKLSTTGKESVSEPFIAPHLVVCPTGENIQAIMEMDTESPADPVG